MIDTSRTQLVSAAPDARPPMRSVTPPVAEALVGLRHLLATFAGEVYLVSKCGVANEHRVRHWWSTMEW